MCKFLSAIVLKNGDLICDPFIDSHEVLIENYNLRDNNTNNFIRIEYSPNNNDYFDLTKYKLHIDEISIPNWFTNDLNDIITNRLNNILNKIIIKESQDILENRVAILCDGVTVDVVNNCKIIIMYGNSRIKKLMGDSYVNKMFNNSQIDEMYNYSQVNEMYDNSQVNEMYDNSKIITKLCAIRKPTFPERRP